TSARRLRKLGDGVEESRHSGQRASPSIAAARASPYFVRAEAVGPKGMFELTYAYATCVRNSEKIAWRVDEVMSADAQLDFSRPFLPAALTGSGRLDFLTAPERLTLNHINGNAYVNLFAFVEEYIVATAVNHAQAEMFADHS